MNKKLRNALIITLVIVVAAILYVNKRTTYHADPERPFIHAEDGRIMILHGFNVLSSGKAHPQRTGSLEKEDILRLTEKWGFNAVRLLVFWDGIEPQKGKYDYEYLNRVKERLDWCEEAGLKVILDMHQDLYAVRYGGDCSPEWAIIDDGEPFEMQSPWELNYFQPAVQAAITNFWDLERGHGELQEHFINAMAEAVKQLGNHPSVVGIEIYNEPTLATLDGFMNMEDEYLTPFYQKAINKLRTVNNDIWIFYEPTAFGPNQGFKSDLGILSDPRKGDPRLVYYPHIYTLDLDINGEYMGKPTYINFWASSRQEEYKKYNTPMLIGEFGLGGSESLALEYVEEIMQMNDKITGGWFYWDYDGSWGIWDYKNGVEFPKARVLDRPYPRMIAGTSPLFSFDAKAKLFSLEMEWSGNLGLLNDTTEIYIPGHIWPDGWNLKEIEGEVDWNFDKDKRLLYVVPQKEGKVHIEVGFNSAQPAE